MLRNYLKSRSRKRLPFFCSNQEPLLKKQAKPLPTIWQVPDALWERIEPILAKVDPPAATDRPRIYQRTALNALTYRMRTGCQWIYLPKDFPDDTSVHRTFQRWVRLGVFARAWSLLIEECDRLGGVDLEWQAADAAMGKPASVGNSTPAPPATRR